MIVARRRLALMGETKFPPWTPIGKTLHEGAHVDERADAWHFSLGDFDFF